MKTLVYINEKRTLQSKEFTSMVGYEKVEITEPFLIVGIFENGLFLDPSVNDLIDYDLKPIEKYLMTSTNVDFLINSSEFRTPNIPFLRGTIPLAAMGQITSVVKEWDEGYFMTVVKVFVDWIAAVDARTNIEYKIFNYKKPGETNFTAFTLNFGYEPVPIYLQEVCYQIFGDYDLYTHLPIGTEFFFSDSQLEFAETNHELII